MIFHSCTQRVLLCTFLLQYNPTRDTLVWFVVRLQLPTGRIPTGTALSNFLHSDHGQYEFNN